MRSRIPILFLLQLPIVFLGAQQYWALTGSIHSVLYSIDLDCSVESDLDWLVTEDFVQYGSSMTPNGNLYGLSSEIYLINTTNGNATVAVDLPSTGSSQPPIQGLACISNTICYSIDRIGVADTLVEINLATGTITPVLPLDGNVFLADLGLFNGDLYYEKDNWFNEDAKLVKIILSNPMVTEIVMDLPDNISFYPMTATSQCHTLLSKTGAADQHVLINTLDGDLNYIAGNPYWNFGITGMVEFETPACVTSVDLDCDDSSGAAGYDYQSPDYYCITENGVPVCDQDIIFLYDTLIDFVTIELSGSIPDGNLEYLETNASYPGLTITGSGTQSILIKNNGTAPSTVFKNAMRNIRYFNDALLKTLGTRLVRVNGKTYYNSEMPEAIAYVEIAYYPVYEPDLGPDTVLCDGNYLVLNSNVTNVAYDWSTGESTQMITVTESGEYAVSVSGNEFCPNVDSVEVTFIPSVTVGLGNTPIGCAGETFGIIVEVESDIPVTIVVLSIPGDTIVLTDVSDDTEVPLVINTSTYFEILSVTSSQAMCLTIDNSYIDFDVLPTYYDTIAVGICEGDSFLIAPGEYVDQPGYYTVLDNTAFGCDSITTYTIHFTQSIDVFKQSTTCMAADTGTFVQFIDNPSGCDTILQTHIVLGPPDTTFVNAIACRTGQQGIFTETLLSVDGCDSIVVRNVILMPPQDTSWSYQTSCDLNAWGTFFLIYPNQEGCDSLAILTINPGVVDTTHIAATSCNPAEMGVFETLLQGQDLCDSLVILTVTMSTDGDTTLLFRTSCDSSFLGVHETVLTNTKGCDSLVIETVTYAEKDTTQLMTYSCNPDETGHFTTSFSNQYGCDSIVIEDVLLSPSHFQTIYSGSCFATDTGTFVQSLINQFGCDSIITTVVKQYPSQNDLIVEGTCHLADTGTFITHYQNQYGCDSMVTLAVSLFPADTTRLISKTCDPAQVGSTQNTFTNQDGCDSVVIESTLLFLLPQVNVQSSSDFNGYDISCFGESDGSAVALGFGIMPFQYTWSTGDMNQSVTGLSAGNYSVTITDANGCEVQGSIDLTQPEEFSIGFEVSQPDCFGHNQGSITVMQTGGVLPIRYSIDGINFQSSPVFTGLNSGTYTVTALDANDCDVQEIIWINVPLMVHVDIGADHIILPGDTVILEAIVNVPFDSLSTITWSGLINPNCPTCLTQPVAPIITTAYSISVSDSHGCSDQDSVVVIIEKNGDIYIPNVFSPNGDGINDRLLISAASYVEEIESMEIFDRWGNLVFAAKNFLPNDPTDAWDGKMRGAEMNPAVYAYKMMARFKDGRFEFRNGDITLIR